MEKKNILQECQPKKFFQRKLLFFAVILLLALIFWSSISLQKMFYDSIGAISAFIENYKFFGIFIFILLAALSAMLSPFSSIPLVPIAIMVFGNILTAVFLIGGWLLGDIAAYFISSRAGYPLLKKLISLEKVEYYKRKIPEQSQFWMVFAFRLSLPAEIAGYTLGIIRYNFSKYVLASFLAEIPFALIAVYSSKALVDKRPFLFAGIIILGIIIFSGTFFILQRKWKKSD